MYDRSLESDQKNGPDHVVRFYFQMHIPKLDAIRIAMFRGMYLCISVP